MNLPSSIIRTSANTKLSHQSLITTFIMPTLMKLSTVAAAVALLTGTMGWDITFYTAKPCNKAPGRDWSYWIYDWGGQSP